jgi:hypothetical protein
MPHNTHHNKIFNKEDTYPQESYQRNYNGIRFVFMVVGTMQGGKRERQERGRGEGRDSEGRERERDERELERRERD